MSVLEVALTIGLFAVLAAFAVPRLIATGQASADRQAKATLGTALDAQIATRASLRSYSDLPVDLQRAAKTLKVATPADSASSGPTTVSVSLDRPNNPPSSIPSAAYLAVFAPSSDSATTGTCWVAKVSNERVLYGVVDISDTALRPCRASLAATLAPATGDSDRGTTPDRPITVP